MPTERQHGGAALIPINLTAPGFAGLNTEAEAGILGQEWATVLTNVVFDGAGRAALRNGFASQTTTPVGGVVMRIHEFVKADGTGETIFSTDADIFSGQSAPSSVEGSLAIAEGNIKFINFNDKCIALGTGTSTNPSIYTGVGDFTTVTVASGTAPTGHIGLSAYGRVWCCDSDLQVIRYSALLDETKWAVVDGGGTIDMAKVWPSGQDSIVAIEEFAGDLVIFGRHNIVIWTDGQGSELGINPLTMYVSDTIPGVGALTQFGIARAKGDLWFLSSSGVQTLQRALQDKTTPTNNVSRNVQSTLLAYVAQETDFDNITLVTSPVEDFALLVFPGSNKVVCFDTRAAMQDTTFRISEWATTLQTAAYFVVDRSVYGSLTGTVGEICKYSAFADDGVAYDFAYTSGWLDFGPEVNAYLKFVKKMTSFVFVDSATTINYTLQYDFDSNTLGTNVTTTFSSGAEFNLSEFSDSGAGIGYNNPAAATQETEFGGGVSLEQLNIPGKGSGQYVKVGLNLSTVSADFSLQSINLYAKIGRIA